MVYKIYYISYRNKWSKIYKIWLYFGQKLFEGIKEEYFVWLVSAIRTSKIYRFFIMIGNSMGIYSYFYLSLYQQYIIYLLFINTYNILFITHIIFQLIIYTIIKKVMKPTYILTVFFCIRNLGIDLKLCKEFEY